MLGTGLTKPLSGIYLECAHAINQSGSEVIAIDIPSGLFERRNKDANLNVAVRAHRTLSFQYPKLCFLLPECASHIGSWEILDIGIPEAYTSAQGTAFFVYGSNEAKIDLQPRSPWGHKGTFGHALLIGGSTGKFGAVILATEACMRSGAGLTSVLTPEDGASALLSRLPEAMLAGNDKQGGHFSLLPELDPYNAIGIGPGLGQHHETAKLLEDLIRQASKPLVLDADALNILSTGPELINALPQGTILTPHPKEFERLFGAFKCTEERMEFMRGLATQRKLNILLKGHYSISALSDGSIHFNTSGNSGMAKGGSGDVLTGILTGLLAQGYSPEKALPFGVYLHGLAADLAIKRGEQESIIPSDLIDQLGASYAAIAGADHQE